MSEKHVKNPFSKRQQSSSGSACKNNVSCLTRHTTHVASFSETSGYILGLQDVTFTNNADIVSLIILFEAIL